ncbi:E3 ubiquitin-protein ligase CHIP isoform X2 [Dermacentor silvarum]|uniref:E3 ubiquitin-protein ligase CHIP isoform X2 n=1 Tax=Dermacentor silvarum TaxID=543639 RepID=UPI002100F9DE|nr:E3 ubiquitin-protein ligase CHIP isoform X2 [Dermacentor silvarum]
MKDTMTAIELKDLGNKLFSARKYEDAISCYSKAIIKSPSTATYFTNRALCYLKLQQWELACQDCRRALDLDPSSVKGHFFLGQALQEMDNYDEAVKYLQRANDLAREQKLNFGDDIACQLRLARKRRWQLIEEKRLQQEIELQTYLNQLILLDKQKRVQEMKMKGTRQADIRTGGGCPGQVHIRVEQHICKGGRQAQGELHLCTICITTEGVQRLSVRLCWELHHTAKRKGAILIQQCTVRVCTTRN